MPRPSFASSVLAAALTALLLGRVAHAAPGDLDGMFGTGGIYQSDVFTDFPGDYDRGLAIDDEQRPVLAARHGDGNYDGKFDVAIMRLTSAGVLDPTFNPNGATPGLLITGFQDVGCPDNTVHGPFSQSVATTPDHHIVVLATLCYGDDGFQATGLMRLDETGAFDPDFDGDGRLVIGNYSAYPEDVAVDSSERIYVAGLHCAGGGAFGCDVQNGFITRFTKQGVRDTTFNANGATPGLFELAITNVGTHLNAIHVVAGDHIVAAGQHFGGGTDGLNALIVRLSGDGLLETTFGPSSTPPGTVVTDLAKPPAPGGTSIAEIWDVTTTDNDQSVLVTGQVTASGATCPLAKFTSTGELDTSFASNGATPGIATLPGATHCGRVSVQSDQKIVVFGSGPRPLGPGLSDTNQIVVGRFNANGTLDASFGNGGVVKTPLGDYAIAEDGDLQSDGKILAAGMTRITGTATINPFVARYVVTASSPTPTGGPQNPTPTPTATPVDHPGEICGNCIDDEHDGYLDRDDPECGVRANGNGQGLGDPKGTGKALVKCGKAVDAAGAKFGTTVLGHLQKCTQAVFACLQVKPSDTKCLPKAATTCAKQVDATAKDRSKLADAITKACAAPDVAIADLTSNTGLGFGAENQPCAAVGVPTVATLADVIACVQARQECAAEQLLAFEVPRASELLVAGGATPGACLPAAGAPGSGLADTDRAKALVKCQATLQKATTKFASGEEKAVVACLQAATSCVQLKPGDPDCLTKLHTTCAKELADLAPGGALAAKLAAAIGKDCATIDAGELANANGLGYQARAAECSALQAPPPASAAAIADCLLRQHECRVAQMLEATTPRVEELLGLGNVSLP